MTYWREETSAEAQQDLDRLFARVMELAERHLAKRGTFAPFAVLLTHAGQEGIAMGYPGGDAPGAEARALLDDGIAQQAADLRAVAVVCDVLVAGHDAVRVELEHRDGPAIVLLAAYRRRRLAKSVTFGEFTRRPAPAPSGRHRADCGHDGLTAG